MICNLVAIPPIQLQGLLHEPSGVLNVFFPDDLGSPNPRLDLDKMWHGLHYVLTGSAWDGDPPISLAVLGGTEIGEDTGYGPPRYLMPDEVRAVAAALDGTPHELFMERFDPSTMNDAELYSGYWDECEPEYMRQLLGELAAFYASAAAAGMAVLICLS